MVGATPRFSFFLHCLQRFANGPPGVLCTRAACLICRRDGSRGQNPNSINPPGTANTAGAQDFFLDHNGRMSKTAGKNRLEPTRPCAKNRAILFSVTVCRRVGAGRMALPGRAEKSASGEAATYRVEPRRQIAGWQFAATRHKLKAHDHTTTLLRFRPEDRARPIPFS